MAALILQLPEGFRLDRNDLGAQHYKSVTSLRIPQVSVKVLLTSSLGRQTWLEAAEINLDANIDIYSSPHGHKTLTKAQLAFIEEQDKATGRAKKIFENLRTKSRSRPGNCVSHRYKSLLTPF